MASRVPALKSGTWLGSRETESGATGIGDADGDGDAQRDGDEGGIWRGTTTTTNYHHRRRRRRRRHSNNCKDFRNNDRNNSKANR